MKFKEIFVNLFFPIFIFIATIAISFTYTTWINYPQGADALFHVFKTKYILANWPNDNWWSIWAGGMPLLLYYPVLPYLLLAVAKVITNLPIEFLLTLASVLAIGLSGLAIYLLTSNLTKSRILAFISSLLYISCPSVWESSLSAGVYMRTLAMPLLIFNLYFAIRFWQEFETGKFDRRLLALISLTLGLTILIHQHVALVTLADLLLLVILVVNGKLLTRVKILALIILIALALSCTFWLPLLKFFPDNPTLSWQTPYVSQMVPLANIAPLPSLIGNSLFPTNNYALFARLTPFLLPLALILIMCLFISQWRKKLDDGSFLWRILKFCGWMTLFWLIYSTGNLIKFSQTLPLIAQSYAMLGTHGATWFLPIFISVAIGILLSLLTRESKFPKWLWLGVITIILIIFLKEQYLGLIEYYKVRSLSTKIGAQDFTYFNQELAEVVNKQKQDNYRLGFIGDTKYALRFNNQFPSFSQTGHYFTQGILNFNLYYYLENVLLLGQGNDNENLYFLDWWGIKPILTVPGGRTFKQNLGQVIANIQNMNLYTVNNPTPLLSPTNTPTVLVVGSRKAYQDAFIHSLALGNLNTQSIIPIIGKSGVEDANINSLLSFDTIFLYDYQVNFWPWTANKLATYVKNGGNLVIESNHDTEINQDLLDPFPISRVQASERSGDWNFKIESSNPYIAEDDLANFSSASYQGGAWGISEATSIKNWAKTILTSNGKPVLVEGSFGKGKVLWSGLNLPFHIVANNNIEDTKVLLKIFQSLSFSTNQDIPKFTTQFVNPQKRIVDIKGNARGVLFKENYFANWHGKAKTTTKNINLTIYQAGPGFMYVSLPKDTHQVTFEYRRSLVEKLADLISIISFIFLMAFLFKIPLIDRGIAFMRRSGYGTSKPRIKPTSTTGNVA